MELFGLQGNVTYEYVGFGTRRLRLLSQAEQHAASYKGSSEGCYPPQPDAGIVVKDKQGPDTERANQYFGSIVTGALRFSC